MMILPSRGRPHLVKRFIEAYVKTEATCPVILWVDADDPLKSEYGMMCRNDELPTTWKFYTGPRMKCPEACAWLFRNYPNEPWYSLFGDDVVPETLHWDRHLILAAGTRRVSYGKDPKVWPLSPHPVVGGDLVRAVGYYALPGVLHWYMDTLWQWLGQQTRRLAPLPHILTPHYNPDLGNAPNDQTYDERWLDLKTGIRHSADYDVEVWRRWHSSGEASKAVQRIKDLCPL